MSNMGVKIYYCSWSNYVICNECHVVQFNFVWIVYNLVWVFQWSVNGGWLNKKKMYLRCFWQLGLDEMQSTRTFLINLLFRSGARRIFKVKKWNFMNLLKFLPGKTHTRYKLINKKSKVFDQWKINSAKSLRNTSVRIRNTIWLNYTIEYEFYKSNRYIANVQRNVKMCNNLSIRFHHKKTFI